MTAANCQSPAPRARTEGVPTGTPLLTVPDLDERALLLLLADREIYEGFSVNKGLEGGPALHRELAVALGRAGQPDGRVVLERLLANGGVEVRRAATFALGELEQPLSRTALLAAAGDTDSETGLLAVEALAKIGVGLAEVQTALADLPAAEQWKRLLPSLYRYDKQESLETAVRGLEVTSGVLHSQAAYALARRGIEPAGPVLRSLLEDDDPWVRGWAARTLGAIGVGGDLTAIGRLLTDSEEGPVIQALRAGKRLIDRGEAAPPDAWHAELLRLADDPRPGVRITALEAAGAWVLDPEISALLAARAESGSRREQQVALLALAGANDPRALDLTRLAAASTDLQLRRRAAQAAGILGAEDVLESLATDAHAAVRVAVLEARLAAVGEDEIGTAGAELAAQALEQLAAPVRVTALGWLASHPVVPLGTLRRALAPSSEGDRVDLELGMVGAVEALVEAGSAEIDQAAEIFDAMARSPEFLVRREAARALGDMGVAAPPVGPADNLRTLSSYAEIIQRTHRDRFAELVTRHGTIRLRLACSKAPLTCLSFLQLATTGFFDGLSFHRVVPDFVVQGGDPSGGGWGGPGYSLRDEINRIRFQTGVLGMARGGPDTAGSQFFITLSPQPHLDGDYTAFGWVEDGLDVLHRIEQEDVILSLREADG